jgi:hypothetical protein
MLTGNPWTEASLVNRACDKIDRILKPDDDREVRVMVNFPNYRGPALSPHHSMLVLITNEGPASDPGLGHDGHHDH